MARKLRLQFPGAIYHVMNRGDRREDIFRNDRDRERFVETLAEASSKTSWQVHAFCLMRNHFHLVVETPEANLVAGMKWLLGTYTTRFNRRHALTGHLFGGRYRSQLVGGNGGYLRTVCDYVHLNPIRAGVVATDRMMRSYPWSSVPLYLLVPKLRPPWMRVDRLFGECGILEDSAAGRGLFEQRLERQRSLDQSEDFQKVRGDWCLGDDEFRQELLAQVNTTAKDYHYGKELHEASEERARRIIAEELEKLNWTESDLRTRRKGVPEKMVIARRLRKETTMTLAWVAERLCMGVKGHLSHLLYWEHRPRPLHGETRLSQSDRLERPGRRTVKAKPVKTSMKVTLRRTDPVSFDTSFD